MKKFSVVLKSSAIPETVLADIVQFDGVGNIVFAKEGIIRGPRPTNNGQPQYEFVKGFGKDSWISVEDISYDKSS